MRFPWIDWHMSRVTALSSSLSIFITFTASGKTVVLQTIPRRIGWTGHELYSTSIQFVSWMTLPYRNHSIFYSNLISDETERTTHGLISMNSILQMYMNHWQTLGKRSSCLHYFQKERARKVHVKNTTLTRSLGRWESRSLLRCWWSSCLLCGGPCDLFRVGSSSLPCWCCSCLLRGGSCRLLCCWSSCRLLCRSSWGLLCRSSWGLLCRSSWGLLCRSSWGLLCRSSCGLGCLCCFRSLCHRRLIALGARVIVVWLILLSDRIH